MLDYSWTLVKAHSTPGAKQASSLVAPEEAHAENIEANAMKNQHRQKRNQ
jgi:hypothetical protein